MAAKRAHVAGLTEATRSEQGRRHYSRQFTGHSLRAGAATSMAKAGAVTAEIAEHGGWSAKSSVVHEYVRRRVLASQPHAQRALHCH